MLGEWMNGWMDGQTNKDAQIKMNAQAGRQ
jgi:hypothetical protein